MLDGNNTELMPGESVSQSVDQPNFTDSLKERKFRHVLLDYCWRLPMSQSSMDKIYKKVFFVLFGRITTG